MAALDRPAQRHRGAASSSPGPETLTYDEIVRAALRAAGPPAAGCCTCRCRSCGAAWTPSRRVVGPSAFATWEEAELMEVPMTSASGTADAESLGVTPLPMSAVLGAA